ncbi:MAG: YeeE/YedE thiosulfate transporter family protein [Saprospiraceae bacterium]
MISTLQQPWPWYIAGPLIGLTVPALLILGNKNFGISSSLRHICASCIPAGIDYFNYDWKKEIWNLIFVLGIIIGGYIATAYLGNLHEIIIHESLRSELAGYGINDYSNALLPIDVVNWSNLLSIKGLVMVVLGGFFVGFGTRYAGGCTSGHSIMGISALSWSSMIATIFFMAGGFIAANLILPFILSIN